MEIMRQTALIVEDDPGTRHVLSSTLATAGIDSIYAATGAAMWQQLVHAPYIIILDLSLPDSEYLELLRQLRQHSDVPVLIHSTRSDEIERIICIEIGAGTQIPTVRRFSERYGGRLIRLNPNEPDLPAGIEGVALPLGGLAGLMALAGALSPP